MADTQTGPESISADARTLRLTPAAVRRARRVTGRHHFDDIAEMLGLPRITFYRLRYGTDPRLSLALSLSTQLGLPVSRLFEPVPQRGTDG
jgi:hypothetical protein